MTALTVYTPLPHQPWGWLPTEQFWARAALTPLTLILVLPLFVVLVPLTWYFPVAWWQSALAIYLYYLIWGGLVERFARKWLVRRRRRMVIADSNIELSSIEKAPAPESRRHLDRVEENEEFMARVFGRHNRLVHHVVNLAFCFLFSYPTWWATPLGVLCLAAMTGFVRALVRKRGWRAPVEALPSAPTHALEHPSTRGTPGSSAAVTAGPTR